MNMNINVAEASFSISRLIASNLRVNQQIAPQPSPGGGRCHPNPISEEARKCNYELEARGASMSGHTENASNMGNKCTKVGENCQQHTAHNSVSATGRGHRRNAGGGDPRPLEAARPIHQSCCFTEKLTRRIFYPRSCGEAVALAAAAWPLELPTKVREDFKITTNRAFS